MSDEPYSPADARLTAFVLGELDEAERTAVEQQIERCPQTRAALEEIRETVDRVTAALQQEPAPALTEAQRAAIATSAALSESAASPLAVQRTGDAPRAVLPKRREKLAALIAGGTVVLAALVLLVLPPFQRDPAGDGSPMLVANGRRDSSGHDPEFYERIGVEFDFNVQDDVGELAATDAPSGQEVNIGAPVVADDSQSTGNLAPSDPNLASTRSRVVSSDDGLGPATEGTGSMGWTYSSRNSQSSGPTAGGQPGRPMNGTIAGQAPPTSDASGRLGEAIQSVRQQELASLARRQEAITAFTKRLSVTGSDSKPSRSHYDRSFIAGAGRAIIAGAARERAVPAGGEQGQAKREYNFSVPIRGDNRRESKPPAVASNAESAQAAAGEGKPYLSAVQLGTADAAEVAKAIGDVLPGVVVNEDGRNDRLHFWGTAQQQQQIAAVIAKLDQAATVNAVPGQQDEAIAALEPANEQYQPIIENEFLSPLGDPLSTFSIDVDTASYSNVRRFLKHNQWPPAAAVRIEELVNYFRYDYPEPDDGRPFAVNLEVGPCPWQSGHRLVRIGLKGKEIDKSQRPPSNLVFLLDVSGSMRDSNKLPLVKTAMEMLVGEMTEDDRIAIVTYSGSAGLALDSTSGQDKTRIVDAIHALKAGGSTNGEAGIKLAYQQAVGHFINDGTNRVILCTDGDFNVGTSDDDELVTLIQDKAKSKVFLSVFGFGMGNLKDGKLEKIADKGNGQYGYIDDVAEARKVFVEELAGTLYTIAKDVKIQVEFNPQQVGAYRLIGYENRMLETPDFNDDTKDAGEIGAGHTVTALYEVVPADKLPAPKPIDDLKYQQHLKPAEDDPVSRELLTLKLRYKQPDADQSVKFEYAVTDDQPRTVMPSVDFEWAASVAGFGLLLRNSQYRGQADFELVRELALGSKGADPSGRRREFLDLVYTAHAMRARQLGQPIPPRESLPEGKAREMAAVGGKYHNLLKKIEVPADAVNYGHFTDYGYWAGESWAGYENLPRGHWVYVVPHWYIWGEASDSPIEKAVPAPTP